MPVIIDFDSGMPTGEKLGEKLGTPGWDIEQEHMATLKRDFYGLEKIKDFILDDIKPGL
jgi:hypothetical protein